MTTFAGTGCWLYRWLLIAEENRRNSQRLDCGRQVILEVEDVLSRGVIDQHVLTADVDADVGLYPV